MSEQYQRIAVVTGATSGFGRATVTEFINNKFAVVGNARSKERLDAMEKEFGTAFQGVSGDGADPGVITALFDSAAAAFGRPADIVVVNAGRGLGGSIKDADLSEFEEMMKINVTGALYLMQKAAKELCALQENSFPQTAADIIVIGSVVGRNISPFSAIYGSSKFAVHALAESLRREIGPQGVRVSLVEPGAALTGFQSAAGYSDDLVRGMTDKFGPLLAAEDIAAAIHFIVSRPPHVHISDITVRPVRQDYP